MPDYQLTIHTPTETTIRHITANTDNLPQEIHRHTRGLLGGNIDIHLDTNTHTGTAHRATALIAEFTLTPTTHNTTPPQPQPGPNHIRYGWTLNSLDTLTRTVVANNRTWWPAGDRNDLYDAAWHGIVEHLYSTTTPPTHRQLLDVLHRYPVLRRSVEIADRVRITGALTAASASLCHWLFVRIDEDDCAFFFARLGDRAGLMTDDPIYALGRALDNLAAGQHRPDEPHVTALVIKAWNAYRDGRSVQLIAYRPGGAKPEPYPEPK